MGAAMPEVRFGVNVRAVATRQGFLRLVRRVDELRYDVLAAPDHLGTLSPFGVLAAAAATTEQPRLRTRRRHERYGFDWVTTHQPSVEALGEVMAAYRGGTGR